MSQHSGGAFFPPSWLLFPQMLLPLCVTRQVPFLFSVLCQASWSHGDGSVPSLCLFVFALLSFSPFHCPAVLHLCVFTLHMSPNQPPPSPPSPQIEVLLKFFEHEIIDFNIDETLSGSAKTCDN